MNLLTRAARRLGLISTLAAAALGIGPAVGSAVAKGLLPTMTVVTSSGITASGATLTATVGTGLLLTPTGTVTFTDESNGVKLGTVPLTGPCLLSLGSCTATVNIPSSSLAGGVNTIWASYNGDLVSKPSSGIGYQTLCGQYSYCEAYGSSADGTAALDVQSQGSDNPDGESIAIGFTTTPLSCSTPNTGDVAVWAISDPTAPDYVVMDTYGTSGQNAQNAHPINSDGEGGHVCYDSPTPFITASGAPATKQPDGTYEGVLAACVDGDGGVENPPCYDGGSFNSDGDGAYETDVVVVPGFSEPREGP